MTTKRSWLPIVAGVAILLAFLGIGAVIVSVSWMREHLVVAPSSEASAADALDAVRARFPGRPPLIEIRDGKPESVSQPAPGASPPASVNTLHVLAWNPRDQRLARFDMPFWLLRLKSAPIQFGTYVSGFDEAGVRLRPEDIERYGPGIILDLTTSRGERVLLWAD